MALERALGLSGENSKSVCPKDGEITNSSGKYLGDQGTGTVVFVRDPAGTTASPEHGTFTMVFVSGSPVSS